MLSTLKNRAKNVLGNETGASNVEIIVWIAVVLVIAVALFAFGGQIKNKITGATSSVNSMNTNATLN